jgi:hypothetical protein
MLPDLTVKPPFENVPVSEVVETLGIDVGTVAVKVVLVEPLWTAIG